MDWIRTLFERLRMWLDKLWWNYKANQWERKGRGDPLRAWREERRRRKDRD
jgi:hypothetical protein